MKKLIAIIITVHCSLFSVHWATAQVINVPGDYGTIQEGINAASPGDLVLVAPGTYYENIRFMGKAITVASNYINSGDTNDINNTIINGSQATNPDSSSVITFMHGEDTTSILQGFTITGGTGTFLTTFQAQTGGGVYAYNSGCKLLNNKIMENHVESDLAGAVGISIITFFDGVWAVIRDNVIKYNTSTAHGFTAFGGGMSATSNALIENNSIIYNVITNDSEYADGGGIELEKVTAEVPEVLIRNNIISHNEIHAANEGFGGGINSFYVPAVIINNEISNNIITGDEYALGGGIHITSSAEGAIIKSNVIENNSCSSDYAYGAGIRITNSGYSLVEGNQINNNSLTGNEGALGGGIYLYDMLDTAEIIENTIANNEMIGISHGAGIFIDQCFDSRLIISRNQIMQNASNNGGGIFSFKSYNSMICNNLLLDNEATYWGGGICFHHYDGETLPVFDAKIKHKKGSDYHPLVVNNTFRGNIASQGGAVYTNQEGEVPVFMNNIFWMNQASSSSNDIYCSVSDTLIIAYNDINVEEVNAIWEGHGNIFHDPQFEDDTCHLSWMSQCIGAGIETLEAYSQIYTCPGDDYDGEMRPQGGAVDIGADESPFGVGVNELRVAGCGMEVYPNPTNHKSDIRYHLSDISPVSLQVLDVRGQLISSLVEEVQRPGDYILSFDGRGLPAGVYFVRLTAGEAMTVLKLVVGDW